VVIDGSAHHPPQRLVKEPLIQQQPARRGGDQRLELRGKQGALELAPQRVAGERELSRERVARVARPDAVGVAGGPDSGVCARAQQQVCALCVALQRRPVQRRPG
jgi:hypothetical protein